MLNKSAKHAGIEASKNGYNKEASKKSIAYEENEHRMGNA